jgi:hypothetical protein
MHLVTIRVISVLVATVACAISCDFSILAADGEPSAPESPSQASPSATAQTGEKTEAQTSPKGTFKIESETKPAQPPVEGNDVADFVVSTTDPNVREPLDEHPEETHSHYYVSPDEIWIYEQKYYGHRMTGGELFKRGEGLKFGPVESKSFDELTWRFFAQHEKLKPQELPFFQNHIGIIDFVAWSPDSARLLVDLRVGDFDVDKKRRDLSLKGGLYLWYAYFNTRSGKLELTDYLRRLNKGAWDRYANFSGFSGLIPEVIAEPLGELPPEAESKKRYEPAERRVKESCGEWPVVDTREIEAKFYAESGPKSTVGRRYWQYMADSTEARARACERVKQASPNE